MRIWDEQDRCWLECEAFSIGSHPVTRSEGWQQRDGSYFTKAAEKHGNAKAGGLPSCKEMIGKSDLAGPEWRTSEERGDVRRCACGRSVPMSNWAVRIRRCWKCRLKRRNIKKIRGA